MEDGRKTKKKRGDLQRSSSRDDLNELLGDDGLSGTVEGEGQLVNHLSWGATEKTSQMLHFMLEDRNLSARLKPNANKMWKTAKSQVAWVDVTICTLRHHYCLKC